METKYEKGKFAEDAACAFLRNKGYTIIKRNYRRKHGEIDIIAEDRGTLAFIEVKYRSSLGGGAPREAVTLRKQRAIIGAAKEYIAENSLWDRDMRFDVTEILKTGELLKIEHMENAFWPEAE